jgi:hypothetical protein
MIITYGGLESFKVQFGDTVLAFNPISKESKHKGVSFGADIAFVSAHHEDLNGSESVSRGDKKPFVVDGPGEYEIKGVFVKGVPSKTEYGSSGAKGEEKINTIYMTSLEGINLCFLGALGSKDLSSEAREELRDIDILFVPIGGQGVLSAAEAYKFALSLEPKIIIPMHYDGVGDKDALKTFLKEGGKVSTESLDKLTIKKKDMEGKEGEIVVLKAS